MTEEREKELLDRIARLEAKINPQRIDNGDWRPRDYTAQMSMPPSTMAEMTNATAGVMADIVADNSRRSAACESPRVRPVPSQNGWRDAPMPPVPAGTRWVDALTGGDAKPYRGKET